MLNIIFVSCIITVAVITLLTTLYSCYSLFAGADRARKALDSIISAIKRPFITRARTYQMLLLRTVYPIFTLFLAIYFTLFASILWTLLFILCDVIFFFVLSSLLKPKQYDRN